MATQKDPNDTRHYDMGINAAIQSGNTNADGDVVDKGIGPVWYDPNLVGAGPPDHTANGQLLDWRRTNTHGIDLWINSFSADFSLSGMSAQSHLKRDFFPRFFTQPEYVVAGQCANNYEYNRLARYIRASQINQVAGAPPEGGGNDLLQLTLKGDPTPAGRTTKGGNSEWVLIGYIKNTTAGAERFIVAPDFTFNFVLVNATSGIIQQLDAFVRNSPTGYVDGYQNYLDQFAASIPDPKIAAPKPWGTDTTKPTKPPTPSNHTVTGSTNEALNPITASFQDFANNLFPNDT